MQEMSSDLAPSLASYLTGAARILDTLPGFATLLAGTLAAANISWGQAAKGKTVLYASVGGELTAPRYAAVAGSGRGRSQAPPGVSR